MARTVAIALFALLACSLVAEISAQKPFCRTSSYKLSADKAVSNKQQMFKNCGAAVKIVSSTDKGGCAVVVQQVASEAAWKAYSDCEKSAKNSALYGPLKAGSDACSANQKSGACP